MYCDFGALDAAVVLQFASPSVQSRVLELVDGTEASLRLPAHAFLESTASRIAGQLQIEARTTPSLVEVSFAGDVVTPTYTTETRRLAWDFWKIVNSVLAKHLLHRGIVQFHAACVKAEASIVMLLGGSGAGKSSTAFVARSNGARVYGSELCFLTGGSLVAGNHTLEVSAAALDLFGLPGALDTRANKLLLRTDDPPEPIRITDLAFVRASTGSLQRVAVGAARARTLLFDNAVSQTAVAALIARESLPLGVVPTQEELKTIAKECVALSSAPCSIVAGSPTSIWDAIMDAVSAPEAG